MSGVRARRRLRAQRRRQHEAADPQVRRAAVIAVDMHDEAAADRRVDPRIDRSLARRRAISGEPLEMDRLLRDMARNARVDDVDDAADRRGAEQQHRRPAQHLDPLGGERVDRHRMIDAGRGGVEAADAVGEHPDAVALEAAQHRPRGARAEGGGGNAGLPGERVADRRPQLAGQLLAAHHRAAGEDVGAVAGEAGDDDLLLRAGMRVAADAAHRAAARAELWAKAGRAATRPARWSSAGVETRESPELVAGAARQNVMLYQASNVRRTRLKNG